MERRLKFTKRLRIPKTAHEIFLQEQGFEIICGVDEVGRGAWAGPLVAGAVILPASPAGGSKRLYGLRDSKLLNSKERGKLARRIKKSSIWGIGEVTVSELNILKMTKSTQLAFNRALKALKVKCDFILVDGISGLYPERAVASRTGCRSLKKGDMTCSSIAAASIIAKVHRDRIMRKLDKKIKGYYFRTHKGYGTKLHQRRLAKLGPSSQHRRFYKSISKLK